MSRIEEDPKSRARNDYHDGQGQSANPYPYSEDIESDYKKYEWEMHRMWSRDFNVVVKEQFRRAR